MTSPHSTPPPSAPSAGPSPRTVVTSGHTRPCSVSCPVPRPEPALGAQPRHSAAGPVSAARAGEDSCGASRRTGQGTSGARRTVTSGLVSARPHAGRGPATGSPEPGPRALQHGLDSRGPQSWARTCRRLLGAGKPVVMRSQESRVPRLADTFPWEEEQAAAWGMASGPRPSGCEGTADALTGLVPRVGASGRAAAA